jgi:hypothetical protein
MPARRRPITAQEAIAQLNADPEWVAKRDARDRELAERSAALRLEERPLLDDLAAAGFSVESVWDLVNSPGTYKAALPVLLSHLTRAYSPRMREGIARALAVKDARAIAWDSLLAMLRSHQVPRPSADGIFVALSAMAQPKDVETLIELIRDPSLGGARIFLVRNLMRSKAPEARTTLLSLQTDPELCAEITARLKNSRR